MLQVILPNIFFELTMSIFVNIVNKMFYANKYIFLYIVIFYCPNKILYQNILNLKKKIIYISQKNIFIVNIFLLPIFYCE